MSWHTNCKRLSASHICEHRNIHWILCRNLSASMVIVALYQWWYNAVLQSNVLLVLRVLTRAKKISQQLPMMPNCASIWILKSLPYNYQLLKFNAIFSLNLPIILALLLMFVKCLLGQKYSTSIIDTGLFVVVTECVYVCVCVCVCLWLCWGVCCFPIAQGSGILQCPRVIHGPSHSVGSVW